MYVAQSVLCVSICLSVCVFLFTFIRSPYSFAICWRIELLHAYRPAHSLCPIHCLFHVLFSSSVGINQSVFSEGREWLMDNRARAWATTILHYVKGISLVYLTILRPRCWQKERVFSVARSGILYMHMVRLRLYLYRIIFIDSASCHLPSDLFAHHTTDWLVNCDFCIGIYVCFYLSLVFIMECYFSSLPPFAAIVGRTLSMFHRANGRYLDYLLSRL